MTVFPATGDSHRISAVLSEQPLAPGGTSGRYGPVVEEARTHTPMMICGRRLSAFHQYILNHALDVLVRNDEANGVLRSYHDVVKQVNDEAAARGAVNRLCAVYGIPYLSRVDFDSSTFNLVAKLFRTPAPGNIAAGSANDPVRTAEWLLGYDMADLAAILPHGAVYKWVTRD